MIIKHKTEAIKQQVQLKHDITKPSSIKTQQVQTPHITKTTPL